jgi:hypothetical protein
MSTTSNLKDTRKFCIIRNKQTSHLVGGIRCIANVEHYKTEEDFKADFYTTHTPSKNDEFHFVTGLGKTLDKAYILSKK